jgi:hypothetical protein
MHKPNSQREEIENGRQNLTARSSEPVVVPYKPIMHLAPQPRPYEQYFLAITLTYTSQE